MKNFLKKLWAILDGNKTIIGFMALSALEKWPLINPWNNILLGVIALWTGYSGWDHFVTKNSLSPNVK